MKDLATAVGIFGGFGVVMAVGTERRRMLG